jgi:hypothetical protein
MTDVDDVVRWIHSNESKSAEDLRRAADVLDRSSRRRTADVAGARYRLACALEELDR